jgi:hypothetical protein
MGGAQTGIVWLVPAGFGVGLAVLVTTPLMKAPTSAGDWLSFAGALLGVGLAVLGALYVEQARARAEKVRQLLRLKDAFAKLATAGASVAIEGLLTSRDPASKLRGDCLTLLSAVSVADYTLARVDIENVELLATVHRLHEQLLALKPWLQEVTNPLSAMEASVATRGNELLKTMMKLQKPLLERANQLIAEETGK